MKILRISRQAILRAIRLASLALFLSAAANSAAHAQTVSGSSSAVTISGSGSNFQYNGTNPITLASGGTVTIGTSPSVPRSLIPPPTPSSPSAWRRT